MRILFVDGTKGFSPHRINEKPCGGIITSLTLVPQHLAKYNEVFVLSDYEKEEKINRVKYIHKYYNLEPDVVVFNRNMVHQYIVDMFKCPKVWWLHDIVDFRYLADGSYHKCDKVVALSHYCVESYSDYYDVAKEKFVIIPNGVDTKIFYPSIEDRGKNLFVCASAPVKGLKPIPYVYENLKRINPDVDFRVYSSQKLHDFKDDAVTKIFMDSLKSQGVKVLDPIPQNELANVLRKARALLMPNHYPEICSNLLLQAQACGCPVIGVPIGSADEFIEHGQTGLLTKTTPNDMFWWWKDFCSLASGLMLNDDLCRSISKKSCRNTVDWSYVGLQWESLVSSLKRG